MTFLLDANVCIQVMRNPRGPVATQFFATPASEMAISVITISEILIGPYRKASPATEHAKVSRILSKLQVVPFDERCADEFAKIAAYLLDAGLPSGDLDVQLAATARVLDLTIVTHNTRHFANIPNLRLQDWQV